MCSCGCGVFWYITWMLWFAFVLFAVLVLCIVLVVFVSWLVCSQLLCIRVWVVSVAPIVFAVVVLCLRCLRCLWSCSACVSACSALSASVRCDSKHQCLEYWTGIGLVLCVIFASVVWFVFCGGVVLCVFVSLRVFQYFRPRLRCVCHTCSPFALSGFVFGVVFVFFAVFGFLVLCMSFVVCRCSFYGTPCVACLCVFCVFRVLRWQYIISLCVVFLCGLFDVCAFFEPCTPLVACALFGTCASFFCFLHCFMNCIRLICVSQTVLCVLRCLWCLRGMCVF